MWAVILYHLGYRWIPGGFLGVDVFFVLSGYLITSLLVADLDRNTLSLRSFWARRARRLLPAVLVLCVVIAVAIHRIRPFPEWPLRQADLLGTIFYVMNWHLVASEQDYFAHYLGVSPLRHAWSLAIEEQFYIVWPLALSGAFLLFRKSRKAIVAAVLAAAGLSVLAMALLYDVHAPSRAYYGTDARAHELLIGALLGLGMTWQRSFKRDRGPLVDFVAVGAVLTLVAAFVLVSDSWSGYYRGGSMLFSLAAAVLLWAVESRPFGVVANGLGVLPLRWVGQISYGLYLWHWPVILFGGAMLPAILGPVAAPLLANSRVLNAVIVVLIVAIATVSYYAIEQPIRRGRLAHGRHADRRALALAPVALGVAAVVAFFVTMVPARAVATESGDYTCGDSARICVRSTGSSSSRPVVAVVGDSTARSLDPGISDLARRLDWTYVAAAQNGCSLIDRAPIEGTTIAANDRCPSENVTLRQQLLDSFRPNLIIATERYLLVDFVDDAGQRVPSGSAAHLQSAETGLEKAALALTSRGAVLVFIETLPVGLPLNCTDANAKGPSDCTVLASTDWLTAEYDQVIERVAARHPDAMLSVSLLAAVCPNDRCDPEVDGVVPRYDGIHFTKPGARWLAAHLYDQLRAAGLIARFG